MCGIGKAPRSFATQPPEPNARSRSPFGSQRKTPNHQWLLLSWSSLTARIFPSGWIATSSAPFGKKPLEKPVISYVRDPPVAGERAIEVSGRRSRRHDEKEHGKHEKSNAAHDGFLPGTDGNQ